MRRAASLNAGSTIDRNNDVPPKIHHHPLQPEPDHAKLPVAKTAQQVQITKSDPNPIEVSATARELAKLPRKKNPRRWTGWLQGVHLWRGVQVVLPGGRVGIVYGILRGKVVVLKDPEVDEFPPFEVFKAAEVQRYKNPNAVALGKLKKGAKEHKSIWKLLVSRSNGRRSCAPGKRRGRPRNGSCAIPVERPTIYPQQVLLDGWSGSH